MEVSRLTDGTPRAAKELAEVTDESVEKFAPAADADYPHPTELEKEDGDSPPDSVFYVCEVCGGQFTVPGKHEEPTQCPWGECHD